MLLDVAGAELHLGHVVSVPSPETGEPVRGYVAGLDVHSGVILVRLLAPREQQGREVSVHGASATLLQGISGRPLEVRPSPGTEVGLAEVEAA